MMNARTDAPHLSELDGRIHKCPTCKQQLVEEQGTAPVGSMQVSLVQMTRMHVLEASPNRLLVACPTCGTHVRIRPRPAP